MRCLDGFFNVEVVVYDGRMIRSRLREAVVAQYGEHAFDVLVPPTPEMGDYSLNAAFVLAKIQKTSPQAVAQELCEHLVRALPEEVERCQVAGPGFVNVFLKADFLQRSVGGFTVEDVGKGRSVIVEYSAPNIAKPMSVGHLRSTIIGDGLARVHKALGYNVVRWNYIGDWGTQFGKLIAAWRRYGGTDQEVTIANLTALYVKFHKEEEENAELATLGQQEFRKLEDGDAENLKLWELFRNKSLAEFSRMYDRLGVQFDVIKGESSYQAQIAPTVQSMKSIVTASEGAVVVMLDEYGLPPALVQKSDGSSIYIVRDVASLQDRISQYHPSRILYVVGNEQSLHFDQLFAIKDKLNLGATETVHVKFGLVLGEDGKKFSTRKGNTILLEDLMNELAVRTTSIVAAKNPNLSQEEVARTAEAVAVAALKYNDLRQHPHSDIVFDWESMLDLGGNSGPYLQYTYARLSGIGRKIPSSADADMELLVHPTERMLMRHLLDMGHAVKECVRLVALNGLALYLYELATLANRYYEEVRIGEDTDVARQSARLALVSAVASTLKEGLDLLGIEAIERI